MGYRFGIGVVVALHYVYLGYLIVGGFLAWRWPRTIGLHILAAVWALVITVFPLVCPLTWLHNWLRRQVGEPPLRHGFIAKYVTGVFYPARYLPEVRLAVGTVVVASWVGYIVIRRPGLLGLRTTHAPRTR